MTEPIIPSGFEFVPAPKERVFEFWNDRNQRVIVRAASVSVVHDRLMFRTGAFIVLTTGSGSAWRTLRECADPDRYLTADGQCGITGDHTTHGIYTSDGPKWCSDHDPRWSLVVDTESVRP